MRRLAAPSARLAAAIGAVAAIGCASMQAPPGGPEDRAPPELLAVSPESGTVSFRGRAVEFRFDEVISDRGSGAASLPQLVLISPRDGLPRVSSRRDAIAVRPRSGWRPNTAYTVTLLPGIADLRGNARTERRTIVLSTGAVMPALALRGRVFDWMAERPAPRAWVEAISRPDSSVYVTVADSGGAFTVGPLPAGTYTVRAFIDQNTNRALDRGEAWDTLSAQPPRAGVERWLELLAAPRDTMPPRISRLTITDSVTVTVEFDRPLDVRQTITPALFTAARGDSTRLPIREAVTRRDFEQAEEARRARADSVRPDTTSRAQPATPPVPAPGPPTGPSTPAPPTQVVLRLGAPLVAGAAYRFTATGVRNLLGRAGASSRVLQVPLPAPPDTTRRTPPP